MQVRSADAGDDDPADDAVRRARGRGSSTSKMEDSEASPDSSAGTSPTTHRGQTWPPSIGASTTPRTHKLGEVTSGVGELADQNGEFEVTFAVCT